MTIAEQLYRDQETIACIRYHFPDCYDDIRQELYIILAGIKKGTLEEKQQKGMLKAYVAAIIANLKRQRYGKVAKMVKGFEISLPILNDPEQPIEEYDSTPDAALELIDQLHPYHSGLLKIYMRVGKIKKVSETTAIPVRTVITAIKEAKQQWKQLCKEKLEY